MKAGISQTTWKWTPLSWISDHWLTTVRTRKPKTRRTIGELDRQPHPLAARGPGPDPSARIADPVQEWSARFHGFRTLVTNKE